jgi:hypothetical protein
VCSYLIEKGVKNWQTSEECVIKGVKIWQASEVCVIKGVKNWQTSEVCVIKGVKNWQTLKVCVMKDYPYLFFNQIRVQLMMMVIMKNLEKSQMKTVMKVKKKEQHSTYFFKRVYMLYSKHVC